MDKQPLLNTYINNVDMEETISAIEMIIRENQRAYVVPINVDVVVKMEEDTYLKEIIEQADMVLVDGKPLVWIAKWQRRSIKAKISGSDLVPKLCEKAAIKGYSIFILGGKYGVAEQARQNLEAEYPGINIVGTYAPPIGFEHNKRELEKINEKLTSLHPDILVVCFGCPKQEKWIYENYQKYNVKVSICAGATVDFLAKNVKRAPKWMSNCGLEWFYRFLQEPKRLFKRYFIDDMKIIKIAFKYR